MATCYDSVSASSIPASAQVVAGYVDGLYRWTNADWNRFPNASKVRIAVFPSTNDGFVLDVEDGDATPAQAPGWVAMRRAAGVTNATIYCSRSLVSTVLAAFDAAGVARPLIWDADWTGSSHLSPGSVATQYANPPSSGGNYDLSVTNGSWPGSSPTPPNPPKPGDPKMNQLSNTSPWNNSKHGDTLTFQGTMNAKSGTKLSLDGIYGPACATACSNYQSFFGIPVDGICGPDTWSLLLHMPLPS